MSEWRKICDETIGVLQQHVDTLCGAVERQRKIIDQARIETGRIVNERDAAIARLVRVDADATRHLGTADRRGALLTRAAEDMRYHDCHKFYETPLKLYADITTELDGD